MYISKLTAKGYRCFNEHFDNFDHVAENQLSDEVFNDLENIEQEVQMAQTAQTTPYTKRKRRRRKRKD
ncbi:hypothetical protein KUL42_08880 [Alteromonas sp. KUL42]|uniref:hypothetical protein n=1 Tax=Alteromonas sp. KUL42 TaxID=2480797 RepID=UPI0010364AC1|nr:hypothetical protein [Alteromonas sp. KUL42]TAP37692.1 hypothetical protein EYR97_04425 [Alteromonas sp. KUL42]GEA06127.1 hypothetical protein KUL42_08880 [Alteromonas sp. KUL42]